MVMIPVVIFKGEHNLDLLNEIEKFRFVIWSQETGMETAQNRFCLDKVDSSSWHFVIRVKNNIVGCSRLTVVNNKDELPDLCSYGTYVGDMNFPNAIMTRLVVDSDYRNQGVGKQLIAKRVEKAIELGVNELWTETLSERIKALQKLDFKEVGQSDDSSIPGNWRILRLKLRKKLAKN